MGQKPTLVPRRIWILWLQGLSEAPFIVKKCVDSWVKENPEWEVVVLDSSNLNQYISLDLPNQSLKQLSLNHRSDLIRVQLLSKYGGVWADATAFCVKPLDDWIDDYTNSGFFAFYKPGRDRIVSSWFIASSKGCPIVTKLGEQLALFWSKNTFNINGKLQRKLRRPLEKTLGVSVITTRLWFSFWVIKLLKIYPYYIFHYMFERLVSSDRDCQAIWNHTPKISADGPHKIKRLGLFSPIDEEIKHDIDTKRIPVYKLTWKYDPSQYSSASVLYYLIQGRDCHKSHLRELNQAPETL